MPGMSLNWMSKWHIKRCDKNVEIKITPLPDVMIKLLGDGGLIEHLKKHGDFSLV